MIPTTYSRTAFVWPLAMALLTPLNSARAEVQVSSLFKPGLVIQRDAPTRVFGTATAGEKISVTLNGRDLKVVADQVGKWEVEFPAQAGSITPQELTVQGTNEIKV